MPAYPIEFTGEKTTESVGTDGKVVRTHTRTGRIETGAAVGTHNVKQNCGHIRGETHYEDSNATLRNIDVDRLSTRDIHTAFEVKLVYSTDAAEPADDDPCSRRVIRSQGSVEQTMYIYKDRLGKLILNKAKQSFSGGLAVSIKLPTWVYEQNRNTYDRTFVSQWCNALNQNTFNGCAEKTLQLGITADEKFEGTYHYWAHRFEMAYVPFGWQPNPCNAGLMQLIASKLKPCLDENRQPVNEPVPLDVNGLQIPIASLVSGTEPNFIDVDFFTLKSYSGLGLQEF